MGWKHSLLAASIVAALSTTTPLSAADQKGTFYVELVGPDSTKVATKSQNLTKYGPVRRTDTLWAIASLNRPAASVSVYQMMYTILRDNPQAFNNGNIHSLKIGTYINLPSQQEATQITHRQAVAALSPEIKKTTQKQKPAPVKQQAVIVEPPKPKVAEPEAKAETPKAAATAEPETTETAAEAANDASNDATNDVAAEESATVSMEALAATQQSLEDVRQKLENRIDELERFQRQDFDVLKKQVDQSSQQMVGLAEVNQRMRLQIKQLDQELDNIKQELSVNRQNQDKIMTMFNDSAQKDESQGFDLKGIQNFLSSPLNLVLVLLLPLLILAMLFSMMMRRRAKRELAEENEDEVTSNSDDGDEEFSQMFTDLDDLDDLESEKKSAEQAAEDVPAYAPSGAELTETLQQQLQTKQETEEQPDLNQAFEEEAKDLELTEVDASESAAEDASDLEQYIEADQPQDSNDDLDLNIDDESSETEQQAVDDGDLDVEALLTEDASEDPAEEATEAKNSIEWESVAQSDASETEEQAEPEAVADAETTPAANSIEFTSDAADSEELDLSEDTEVADSAASEEQLPEPDLTEALDEAEAEEAIDESLDVSDEANDEEVSKSTPFSGLYKSEDATHDLQGLEDEDLSDLPDLSSLSFDEGPSADADIKDILDQNYSEKSSQSDEPQDDMEQVFAEYSKDALNDKAEPEVPEDLEARDSADENYVDIDTLLDEADDEEPQEPYNEANLEVGLEEFPELVDAEGDENDSELASKLDLARAYLEIDDQDGARKILDEVMEQGDEAMQADAEKLLKRLK